MQRLWRLGALVCLALVGLGRAQAQGLETGSDAMRRLLGQARSGLPLLTQDPLLALAAGRYAAELEARGVLDHTGEAGDRVVDRLRGVGITEARMGEILGAGPDAPSVLAAWLSSPAHERVVRDPAWTHVGVGLSPGGRVWVALFVARQVSDLVVRSRDGNLVVSGRLLPSDVDHPVLAVDLRWYEPVLWRPRDGVFRFDVGPAVSGAAYVRLGYVTALGGLRFTNVLTLGPQGPRGEPAGPERPAADFSS